MLFHIPCLKYVLLLCTLSFPSAFAYIVRMLRFPERSRLLQDTFATVVSYGVLIVITFFMGELGILRFTANILWYPLAVVCAFLNITVEFVIAAFPLFRKYKKLPALTPTKVYYERTSLLSIVAIILAATAEEVVFRQIIISVVMNGLSVPVYVVIIISACLYALNHVYFGRKIVLQKLPSGLIFSLIFVLSGYALLPVILCHASQNLILYFYSSHKYANRKTVQRRVN